MGLFIVLRLVQPFHVLWDGFHIELFKPPQREGGLEPWSPSYPLRFFNFNNILPKLYGLSPQLTDLVICFFLSVISESQTSHSTHRYFAVHESQILYDFLKTERDTWKILASTRALQVSKFHTSFKAWFKLTRIPLKGNHIHLTFTFGDSFSSVLNCFDMTLNCIFLFNYSRMYIVFQIRTGKQCGIMENTHI